MADIYSRHIEYSKVYGAKSAPSELPAAIGRATKTIEKRRQKYGEKAASAEAIKQAKEQ